MKVRELIARLNEIHDEVDEIILAENKCESDRRTVEATNSISQLISQVTSDMGSDLAFDDGELNTKIIDLTDRTSGGDSKFGVFGTGSQGMEKWYGVEYKQDVNGIRLVMSDKLPHPTPSEARHEIWRISNLLSEIFSRLLMH